MTSPKTNCTAVTIKGKPAKPEPSTIPIRPDPNAIDRDATLDELAEELDWDTYPPSPNQTDNVSRKKGSISINILPH